mmetsp:Transcript_10700/g.13901  ORF Transcript_10700/g.13901 Transcript_10700/m.13901 type:complete len:156 (+) Transcript_10700:3-470(+)
MSGRGNITRGPMLSQSMTRLQGLKDMQRMQAAESKVDAMVSENSSNKKTIKLLMSALKNLDPNIHKSFKETLEMHSDGFEEQRDSAVSELIHRILDDDYEVWADHALREYSEDERNNYEATNEAQPYAIDYSRAKTAESSLPILSNYSVVKQSSV